MKINQGVHQKGVNLPSYSEATADADEFLPEYHDTATDIDVDTDDISGTIASSWNQPSWNSISAPWDIIKSGGGISRMVPEIDTTGSEHGDGSSTKVEDGGLSSPSSIQQRLRDDFSDNGFPDQMEISADRSIRESAPPPDPGDDDEEFLVQPLNAPDAS